MKLLIYELFSGVGFCNQLFSLETAIYFANITNRKLILLVRYPLCHCGRSSWDYGNFVDFFSDDYKRFLPFGIDIYYRNIPIDIQSLINNDCKYIDFGDKLSRVVIIDSNINIDTDVINFCSGRKQYIINYNLLDSYKYIYINQSNSSRCFYNFYTSKENYKLMSDICFSLTKLKDFDKIYIRNVYDYITLHLRLGDQQHSTEIINNHNTLKNINNIITNIDNNISKKRGVCIMCDRKDGNILQKLTNLYNVIFIEDLLIDESYKKLFPNIKNYSVIEFLIQMKICTTSDCFIGYETSTVSNYIQYIQYIHNKTHHLYSKNNISYGSSYTWVVNNYRGPGIGWQIFFKDNIVV